MNTKSSTSSTLQGYWRHQLVFIVWILATGLVVQNCSSSEKSGTEQPPQEKLPMKQLSLQSLKAFQSTGSNWSIVGGVTSNRQVEHDLHSKEGTGILANNPTKKNDTHIFTKWSHGDLELELDFLMPKGSNSGIYLMGRYEVQLLDSWGIENPTFQDAGGIYQRWNESKPRGNKGFEGSAPRLNAARAPGLWQHLKILFHAPEFDQQGNKITDAKFVKVRLNGVLVQKDVSISGPTRSAAFEDEVAKAPLMIQGDHGPVAVRNIEYKRYDKEIITLRDLKYKYFPGAFKAIPDFDTLKATETGTVDSLAGNIIDKDKQYALEYSGILQAPNSGTYFFKIRNAGLVRMLIDGKPVFDQSEIHRMYQLGSRTITLDRGQHDFSLAYVTHPNEWYWGLSLMAEGPKLRLRQLHSTASVPGGELRQLHHLHRVGSVSGGNRKLPDLIVQANDRVKTLRSFAMHKNIKRTHVINVGGPSTINFSYDLGQSALLQAWEGPFVNTNEMWNGRGLPQIVKPAGPPITFDGFPSVSILQEDISWPDSLSWKQLEVEGYTIDDNGWPIFNYKMGDVLIKDRLQGYDQPRHLVRTIRFEAPQKQGDFRLQLASGSAITRNEAGEYVIDNRRFYLDVTDSEGYDPRIVQTSDDRYGLRIPVLKKGTEAEITYEIIW